MADRMTNVEIEDILSSIRRLVSEEARAPLTRQPPKLVLTAAERVLPPAETAAAEAAEDALEVRIAELEALLGVPADMPGAGFEAEEGDPFIAPPALPRQAASGATGQTGGGRDLPPIRLRGGSDADGVRSPEVGSLAARAAADAAPASAAPGARGHDGAVDPAAEQVREGGTAEAQDMALQSPRDAAGAGYDRDASGETGPDAPAAGARQRARRIVERTDHPAEQAVEAEPEVADPVWEHAPDGDVFLDPAVGDGDLIDEAMLREMVRDILHDELRGQLGERITRNVRKLVRAEIARVMASRDL
ncbi:MAG: hypothetical protein ACK4TB_10965 [Gemmobacter sp.]